MTGEAIEEGLVETTPAPEVTTTEEPAQKVAEEEKSKPCPVEYGIGQVVRYVRLLPDDTVRDDFFPRSGVVPLFVWSILL